MLNRQKILEASETFRMIFMHTMQNEVPADIMAAVTALAQKEDTSDFTLRLRWFESMPVMRHWVGDRVANKLAAQSYDINVKPYEDTLEVLRDDIMFDRLGGYRMAIAKITNELQLWRARELGKVIADGFAGTTYGNTFDGYPLFSASHAFGSNTGTAALAATSLTAAKTAFNAFADAVTGDLLSIPATHLWYYKPLDETVKTLLDMKLVQGTQAGIENIHYKSLQPLCLPYMPSGADAYWGLCSVTTDPLKPVIWMNHPGSEDFVSLDDPDSYENFIRRKLLYGVEYWGAMAPGFPMYIWGSNGTT